MIPPPYTHQYSENTQCTVARCEALIGDTFTVTLRLFSVSTHSTNVRFRPKVDQISPKWKKKSGTFSDQISVHFGSQSQNVLISDLKKSRICPIWDQSDPFWKQSYPPWKSYSDRHDRMLSHQSPVQEDYGRQF